MENYKSLPFDTLTRPGTLSRSRSGQINRYWISPL